MTTPPPKVPTWRIFPGPGGHFRWCPVGHETAQSPQELRETLGRGKDTTSLPSMADLLLQAASSKIMEGGGGGNGGGLIFRTGSGRPVSVKDSSIRKAEAVLGGEGYRSDGCDTSVFQTGLGNKMALGRGLMHMEKAIIGRGSTGKRGDGGVDGAPMLQTGSGILVNARKSSNREVAPVALEVHGDGKLDHTRNREDCGSKLGMGYRRTNGQSLIQEVASDVGDGMNVERSGGGMNVERSGGNGAFPMFQTGSGKSVTVKANSIRKAASILNGVDAEGGEENSFMPMTQSDFVNPFKLGKILYASAIGEESGQIGLQCNREKDAVIPMFQTGSGKSVTVRQSSVRKAVSILEGDTTNGDPGGTVHISPAALFKANTSLGLEENCKISTTECSKHPFGQHSSSISNDLEDKCTRTGDSFLLESRKDANDLQFDVHASASLGPPIKFHTASKGSLLISHDAMQRARNLLGEFDLGVLESGEKTNNSFIPFTKEEKTTADLCTKENISLPCVNDKVTSSKSTSNGFCRFSSKSSLSKITSKEIKNKRVSLREKLGNPLAEISNTIDAFDEDSITAKKRVRRKNSASSFKRPRTSRFSTPLKSNVSCLPATGLSNDPISKEISCKSRVSTHYPFQFKRKNLIEFFGGPPHHNDLHLSEEVLQMTAERAERYKFSTTCDSGPSGKIEVDSLQHMLVELGASSANCTKEWITNHHKWIVWKLACLERSYPTQASGKFFTISNVIEELKYRYEREVNYGHKSALRKILDGDASPASLVVLCISAIIMGDKTTTSKSAENNSDETGINVAKVELTDGWYSLNAILDEGLSKHLHTGKLFIGQKLRIWGAGLRGWVGPVSPFEASKTVNMLININGTYRAHWADKMGFCKKPGAPLSFNCIKGGGGPVPRTIVGVSRIYPILYKERFHDGGSIVRTERLESKISQLYHQRHARIAEDIMLEQQDFSFEDTDSEEGAKIFKILQNSVEPEVLMADMSAEQLLSFSAYQAKQAAVRQSDLEKKIEKAIKDAGLGAREVTPFIRVRVVGLTCKGQTRKCRRREGLITIWNPTEKLKSDLVEGQIYSVSGLVPLTTGSDLIYLQARGRGTTWNHVSSTEKFQPFFSPRKPASLLYIGEFPLASEFDIALVVLHVGEVYVSGHRKKQWIFASDGSVADSGSEHENCHDLLAINFWIPYAENDPSAQISHALSGSIVCFFNLVKRPCDQTNHIWVAEATENSAYVLHHSLPVTSHLKESADAAKKWSKRSSQAIQKLKERILSIIGKCGS